MSTAHEYAMANADRFLEEFQQLLRIPSVSTDPAFADDVVKAANWIAEMMRSIGMSSELIAVESGRHPLVLGTWNGAGADAPTVLIYCHYDVQPAVVADGWVTEPFDPTIVEGKLFARGATDSKVHVMAWMKAVEALLKTGGSPVNIKLLFEGEEESGSESINAYIDAHADSLAADAAVISDGIIRAPDQPSITYGLRGIITFEIHVEGPQQDLHSGHFGGTVHNPAQAVAEIVAKLHDEEGRVTIPGFYDNVAIPDEAERAIMQESNDLMEAEWREVANPPARWGEPDYNIHERVGARPTLEVNGIYGGYTGEGMKTVLPGRAFAKISCRLVPDQDPDRISKLAAEYIQSIAPESVRVTIHNAEMGAPAMLLNRDSKAVKAAFNAYEYGWGVKPLLERAGGSVPITFKMQKITDNITLMGFSYKGGTAHGPNENIYVDMFDKGIASAIYFLQNYGGDDA